MQLRVLQLILNPSGSNYTLDMAEWDGGNVSL